MRAPKIPPRCDACWDGEDLGSLVVMTPISSRDTIVAWQCPACKHVVLKTALWHKPEAPG